MSSRVGGWEWEWVSYHSAHVGHQGERRQAATAHRPLLNSVWTHHVVIQHDGSLDDGREPCDPSASEVQKQPADRASACDAADVLPGCSRRQTTSSSSSSPIYRCEVSPHSSSRPFPCDVTDDHPPTNPPNHHVSRITPSEEDGYITSSLAGSQQEIFSEPQRVCGSVFQNVSLRLSDSEEPHAEGKLVPRGFRRRSILEASVLVWHPQIVLCLPFLGGYHQETQSRKTMITTWTTLLLFVGAEAVKRQSWSKKQTPRVCQRPRQRFSPVQPEARGCAGRERA